MEPLKPLVLLVVAIGLSSCSIIPPQNEFRSVASAHPPEKRNVQSYIHNIALSYNSNSGDTLLVSLVDKRTVNTAATKHLNVMGRNLDFKHLYKNLHTQRSLPNILCQSRYRGRAIAKVEYYVTDFSPKWWWNEARRESKKCL